MNLKKLFRIGHRIIGRSKDTVEQNDTPQQLPLQNMFYGLGFIILFFWILKTFKFIFIAITLSMFSCFMLLPIIHFIVRHTKLNRTFISAIISLVYTLLLVLTSGVIANNLLYFFSNLSVYEDQLNNIINDIILRLNNVINGINNDIIINTLPAHQPSFDIRDYIFNSISLNFYLNSANSFFTFVSGAILVFIFVFFILNEAEKTSLKLKIVLRTSVYKSINKSIKIISMKISRYLQIKMVISFFTAFLVWVLLTFYKVENPVTWAFFTFAFNFIPNIGSIAITVLITLMSIIQFYPSWDVPLVVGLLIAAIQILIGNILDPKLQGDRLDLSSMLILISLAFWGYIWGIVGMFLAVPMLEILRITCSNIKGLQPITIFISSGKDIRNRHRTKNTENLEPRSEQDLSSCSPTSTLQTNHNRSNIMEIRQVGNSDLHVSKICLGTMTWGYQNTETQAHEQMDYALSRGINFWDTAELYAVPPSQDSYGKTEGYIGTWFAKTGRRKDVILASKVGGPGAQWIRTGREGFTPEGVRNALEDSLKRLQTDYIDLYQLHWPQRQVPKFGIHDFDPGWSKEDDRIESTLGTLGELIAEGKIRYIGLSNETPWGVMRFLELHRQNPDKYPRIQSVQNAYSLVNRITDIHLSEVLLREQVSLLPYSPLAGGLLSGKYQGGKQPEGARFSTWGANRMSRYLNSATDTAVGAYVALAKEFGISPAILANSFANDRPFVAANIIGATNMDQLKENIDSAELILNKEQLAKIEEIHMQRPNPSV
ncbi:aldo/keto reductase [Candidatus Haliotispira prima]|uniref:Aldo/keto reductase n=1 Tax=Candidatus Haliotispira prima TaxID=3034016 RepID=A0ABY8MJK6_9SPIO|nr:aldo/keto reductase [Candidatus Haliotispira prima]